MWLLKLYQIAVSFSRTNHLGRHGQTCSTVSTAYSYKMLQFSVFACFARIHCATAELKSHSTESVELLSEKSTVGPCFQINTGPGTDSPLTCTAPCNTECYKHRLSEPSSSTVTGRSKPGADLISTVARDDKGWWALIELSRWQIEKDTPECDPYRDQGKHAKNAWTYLPRLLVNFVDKSNQLNNFDDFDAKSSSQKKKKSCNVV